MKQYFLFLIFSFSGLTIFAQQAEQIYSITKKQKNYAYYSQQADLWEKEVKKSQKSANAWFNYYKAARMNNMFAGSDGSRYDMDAIAKELKTNLPNSFEYHYVDYKQEYDREKGYPHLLKAYTLDPERYETWDGFISKGEIEGDTKAMKTFFEKWYQHEMYSPGLTTWNYNAIIGLEKDAVFITFGDNDTYPVWFLQQVKNVRTDIANINASLLLDQNYRNKIFTQLNIPSFDKKLEDSENYETYRDELMEHVIKNIDRPTYIGISAPHSFRKTHHDQLFIVGLAFKYCSYKFDHVAVIRNNYENLFLKDYLTNNLNNDFSQSVVDYHNQQYIPCLTVLYKHYLLSGETRKADKLADLLIHIGDKCNRQEEIADFLEKQKKTWRSVIKF